MARSTAAVLAAAVLLLASFASAARVIVEDNAYKLASKLVDKHSLTILKGGKKAAKYLGHDHSAGISGNTVVFTTGGNVKDAMDKNYDPWGDEDPIMEHENHMLPKIRNSYDGLVLDFWVKAKSTGRLSVQAEFETLEAAKGISKIHEKGTKPYDTLQFEVNGKKLSVIPTSDGDKPVSWKTIKDHKEELSGHDSIHKGGFTVPVMLKNMHVKKGDELRFKIRLADIDDRLVDSFARFRAGSLMVSDGCDMC